MSRRRALAFAATAGAVVAADQVTKAVVRGSLEIGVSEPVIDGVLWLTRVRNTGAAFGLLPGGRWLFVATSLIVLGAVAYAVLRVRPESTLVWGGLALVTGGAIGNLIDRALAGGVTDFLDVGWWPVFNVADIALDTGVVLIAWWLLFSSEHRPSAAHPSDAGEEGAGGTGVRDEVGAPPA